jgi:dinuclear metal center YbgI/SA1388 family protein
MPLVNDICGFLERFAPPRLAEEWDNVGLLVGRRDATVERIMTCLTVTPASAAEAVADRAQLIVTHHPLPFRALKRLTADTTAGTLLLDLIAAGVAVHSPHTAFDSAATGINQRLAEGLGLEEIVPLVSIPGDPDALGAGRHGRLREPAALGEIAAQLGKFLSLAGMHVVGPREQRIERVAVACGSAGQFLEAARAAGCELLVTGETTFHTCLEAEAGGVALLLPGHYASERFAVEQLAEVLAREFPAVAVWASRRERDPLQWLDSTT